MTVTQPAGRRQKPDSDIVRHSYEQALIRLARLASYAEAGETKIDSHEVTSRQNQLTIDDIIILSISIRRLLDVLNIRKISSKIKIIDQISQSPNDLRSIINKIIHSNYIKLANFTFELKSDVSLIDAYAKYQNKEKHRISPLILIVSEHNKTIVVKITDFCEASNSALAAATDTSARSGIYLELE